MSAQTIKTRLFLAAIVLSLLSAPAISATGADAPSPQPSAAIATRAAASDDGDIAARIRTIFEQIQALQNVSVRVSSGVVTLAGKVPTADDRKVAKTQKTGRLACSSVEDACLSNAHVVDGHKSVSC